jgi:TM2 domain-containing membrane protein YozV
MCDNLNGPTFTKYKFDVFMIKYPNGTSTVISSNQNNSSSNYNSGGNNSTKNKDNTTALLLCLLIIIGLGGIHRLYLGYVGIGILQLLTGGCCGIWQIIDLIRILTGSLKPKDGEYKD